MALPKLLPFCRQRLASVGPGCRQVALLFGAAFHHARLGSTGPRPDTRPRHRPTPSHRPRPSATPGPATCFGLEGEQRLPYPTKAQAPRRRSTQPRRLRHRRSHQVIGREVCPNRRGLMLDCGVVILRRRPVGWTGPIALETHPRTGSSMRWAERSGSGQASRPRRRRQVPSGRPRPPLA